MHRIDIDVLQALCAIQDHGGVTRAAKSLALSQSAVSHKIRRLEERLGRVLLTRNSGGPTYTEDGRTLLGYARRILALHDEAVMSLGRDPLRGALRLGMTEDTTTSGLSRILGRFDRLHPDVSVRTHVAQSLTLEAELERGEIDLAIFQTLRHQLRDTDIALYEDSLHWVKSPDLPLDLENPIPFLAFDDECFYRRWAFEDPARPGDVTLKTVLTCASASGIAAGVLAGLGVALLNGRHLTPEMEIVDDLLGPPPGIVYLIRVGSGRRSQTTRALVDAIVAEDGPDRSLRVA